MISSNNIIHELTMKNVVANSSVGLGDNLNKNKSHITNLIVIFNIQIIENLCILPTDR